MEADRAPPTDADDWPPYEVGCLKHQPDELVVRRRVLPGEALGPCPRAVPGEGVRGRCPGQQRTQFGFREGLLEEVSVMHRYARPRKELLRPPAGGSGTLLIDIDVHVSPTAPAAIRSAAH